MREIPIKYYVCDYCGKIFRIKKSCREHERYDHKCKECSHSYYVYGVQLECEREKDGKRCSFKKKNG